VKRALKCRIFVCKRFLGGALSATLTLLTELVLSGMKGMAFKDLFQVWKLSQISTFLFGLSAINRELSRAILNVQQQISPCPLVFLPAFLAFTSCILITAGLPRSGKNQGKEHFFKVREFVKKSGKIFDIVKVREYYFHCAQNPVKSVKSLKTKTWILMIYQKSRSKCKHGFFSIIIINHLM